MKIRVTYDPNFNGKENVCVLISTDGGNWWHIITLPEIAAIIEWIGFSEDIGYQQGDGKHYLKSFLTDIIENVIDSKSPNNARVEVHSRYRLKPMCSDQIEITKEAAQKRKEFYKSW